MAGSTYITSSFNGTGSSTGAKSTHSVWVKRCDPELASDTTARSTIISGYSDGSHNMKCRFADGDAFHVYGIHGGSANINLYSSIECRDVGAWYHVCLQVDTTHATEAERLKIFINGVEGTYSGTYPAQNAVNYLTSTNSTKIGANQVGSEHYDGYMSHFHGIDGTIYPPTAFAETDATSGIWKPITEPSVTYGSKGFFIFKDGAGLTDQSGNSNNFTLTSGTLTATKDNPSNNYATMNTLDNYYAASDFTNGNNTVQTGTSAYSINTATLGMTKSKWYWECKLVADSASGAEFQHGITDIVSTGNVQLGATANSYAYYTENGNKKNNNSATAYGNTAAVGDIISVAVDLDNNKIYFAKNGTWENSGDPTSGATGTGAAFTITAPASTTNGHYFPANGEGTGAARLTYGYNFGNGYFGTTAISSAGANGGGSLFEYDVPTGYYALNSKNIATYG